MSRIVWDQVGSRRYETGLDRGVLYLPDSTGVPWNGLTTVEDDLSGIEVESYYLDGVKYMDKRTDTDWAGSLSAFTYPDEFAQFDGIVEFQNGLFSTAQPVDETFGLSYRSLLGSDTTSPGDGYKIHLLYNLTAQPDNRAYVTQSASPTLEEFSWKLTGVPIDLPGMRPAAHIVIDSTRIPPNVLNDFERYLYGDSVNPPMLPLYDVMLEIYDGSYYAGFDLITDPITEPL